MRIAIWCPTSLTVIGGGTKWAVNFARGLLEMGHSVSIFGFPLAIRPTGSRILLDSLNNIPYSEGLSHFVENFDVVYLMYSPFWRSVRGQTAIVAGIHTPIFYQSDFFNPLFCFKMRGSLGLWLGKLYYSSMFPVDSRKFTLVHILSRAIRCPNPRMIYLPNWIDTNLFTPDAKQSDRFLALYVGDAGWEKGWDRFVLACKLVKSKRPNTIFCAAGQIRRKLPDINVLGLLDENEISALYKRANVVILPARANAFPLTVLEALASGTPVIASRIPTHVSQDLPLIYADSPHDIAAAIIKVYDLWEKWPQYYDKLCRDCRATALKYDKKDILPRYVRMLEMAYQLYHHG